MKMVEFIYNCRTINNFLDLQIGVSMRLISMLLGVFLAVGAHAEPVTLLVDFDDDASNQDIRDTENDLGLQLTKNSIMYSSTKITKVVVDSSRVQDYIDKISGDWDIENIEVSQTYSVLGSADFDSPNDPAYSKQRWHFDMINLEDAWRVSTGKDVTVAIVDTGISSGDGSYPRIPDLAKTCFVEGYNFVDNNDDPYDVQSHGTHVGSSVAESTNNDLGGVGVAFDACLMPVKVLSDSGSGSTEDIAEGIRFAVDNGAEIINMSLGGGGFSKVLFDALQYAKKENVLVFCAAGNGSRPVIEFPAAMDGCIPISSVGPCPKSESETKGCTGNLAPYSSHGEGKDHGVFLASPGGDTRNFGPAGGVWQSTVDPEDPTKWGMFPYQGTSMATPIAAGVAALVVSNLKEQNGGYDRDEVLQILEDSATDKGDTFKYGAGVVNAGKAVGESSSSHPLFKLLGFFGFALAVAFVAHWKMTKNRR
jgi:serine protease